MDEESAFPFDASKFVEVEIKQVKEEVVSDTEENEGETEFPFTASNLVEVEIGNVKEELDSKGKEKRKDESQPIHGPIQSQINVTSTSKPSNQVTSQGSAQTAVTTVSSKPICYASATSISTRPVAVVASQSIPIAKILPQGVGTPGNVEEGNNLSSAPTLQTQAATSVYIQAHRTSPGSLSTQTTFASERSSHAPTLSTYTLPACASTTFYYEAPSGYQLAPDAPLVARPLAPDTPLVSRQLSADGPLIARPYTPGNTTFVSQSSAGSIRSNALPQSHGLIPTSQTMRYNPVMIVDPSPVPVQSSFAGENATLMISESPLVSQGSSSVSKLISSPRPSILRKRDNEGSPAKASKNLTSLLSSASVSRSSSPSPPSLHLETTHQHSNDNGPSSNGSTTISATSSPGLEDQGENSMPPIKTEMSEETERPPVEMSPRKKPRKQQLNDANDAIDMEFISDDRIKKERDDETPTTYVVKRPNISLLNSYRHSWKSRHNHFLRYSDVRAKDDRRPTVTDLANQKHITTKVNGWKVYHLSAQMENFSDMETQSLGSLSTMLDDMEKELGKEIEKETNRVNDLIMGTIQRSKVIKDQMQDAKVQVLKLFDHKGQVKDIINRCASKRNFKKRDKY